MPLSFAYRDRKNLRFYNGLSLNFNPEIDVHNSNADQQLSGIYMSLGRARSISRIDGLPMDVRWEPGHIAHIPSFVRADDIELVDGGEAWLAVTVPASLLCALAPDDWADHVTPRFGITDWPVANLSRAVADLEDAHDPLLVDYLTMCLASKVMRWHGLQPYPDTEPIQHRRIKAAIDYIEGNVTHQLTINQLSDVAAMSPFHFARQFRKVTGRTPHNYVCGRRVERARSLIQRGGMTLASIAFACGFANQSHFTTQFKGRTGTTPAVYQRSVGMT